jgi:hypothetical protein
VSLIDGSIRSSPLSSFHNSHAWKHVEDINVLFS